MASITEINTFYKENYNVLLKRCNYIIKKYESYHSYISPIDLLNTVYLEMIRKKDKIVLNTHYFYTYAKNEYRYYCFTLHDESKVSIKSEDNECGFDVESLEYMPCDNEYLNDELTQRGKQLLEIVKGTLYYNVLDCIMNYDNIDIIQKKLGLSRKKITNYIWVMTELANYDNINNIHSINHFLMMKKRGFKNCDSKKTLSNKECKEVKVSLNPTFYNTIKKRSDLLKQSLAFMISNDLNNEYNNSDLCVLSNYKRINNDKPIITSIDIEINALMMLKERSKKYNNSISKQMEFDLINYYNRMG